MSIWGNTASFGGGGGIPLLTRTEWNALTTEQKRSYDLLAIQDSSIGFSRGELVCGSEYQQIGIYLPYSNEQDIICESYVDNFDNDTPTIWGYGIKPIQMQSGLNPSLSSGENAVYLGINATGKFAYVDLGENKAPFTAYIIAKLVNPGGYTRIISSMASRSSGQGMLLFGSTINVSSWASDSSTGISSSAAYFAAAFQFNGINNGAGIVGSSGSYITKSPSNSSQYLTIGRTDIDANTQNAEPANMYLRYFAVVNEYESENVIRNNLSALENAFLT